ncbi:hypothetical protein TWF506_010776 [Arthrobotrys conoides]|uniref:Uncharacterized protein n=1 Tax=Arthrobotrys conoides TaxID=74498 RepID=A0AAN8RW08_9PEZI
MATPQPQDWRPAMEIPIDPKPRIEQLKSMLDDPETCQEQIPNIRAVLADYEAGRCPSLVYQDGKAIDLYHADVTRLAWFENGKMYADSCVYQPPAASIT